MLKKIAIDLLQKSREVPALLAWRARLRGDPNFDPAGVDRGLAPRPPTVATSGADRLRIAQRVLDAYGKAAADLQQRSELYRVSNEWIPIFQKPLRPLLDALQARDAHALQALLDNFFRNSISTGLCGLPTDMETAFFKAPPNRYRRYQYLVDGLYRFRLLQELVPGVTARDLAVPDVGNPYGLFLDGTFVRNGTDYQYYYASRVAAELRAAAPARAGVVELGGGTGGFAYFLNTLHAGPLTYINVDLPEILCISSYQLLNLFPQRSFLLYGEQGMLDAAQVAQHDIALLPSFAIEALGDDSVDVAFNSYSLAEMSPEAISNYVRHLSRVSRRAILHVNHVSDAALGADDFSFDPRKFELQGRTRARWNLARNARSDEFEFLLRRRAT